MSVQETPSTKNVSVVRYPASTYTPEYAYITVGLPSGTTASITVTGPRTGRAGVNWSAIGTVSPSDAVAYANGLLLAADLAPTLSPATGA